MLKLDSVPLIENGWAGWAYCFSPKDDAPKQQSKSTEFDDVDF